MVLTGCKGLKDALTAHTDVAASTVDRELSATRLGNLLGNAKIGVEPSKENAQIVADLWSDYQRLGYAAAHGDSLTGNLDVAMKSIFDNMRVSMMIDTLRSKITTPTNPEVAYNAAAGGVLGARHILFKYPEVNGQPGSATPAQKDSVRKFATAILPQINNANFVAMVKTHSGDHGSIDKGGAYPAFPRDHMVPAFTGGSKREARRDQSEPRRAACGPDHRLAYADAGRVATRRFRGIAQTTVDSTITAKTR